MKRKHLFFIILALISTFGGTAQSTLRIAHMADPQLGFGPGGFDDDLAAFIREIDIVNRLKPDIAVIAGDMVNRMDSASVARFRQAAAALEMPVYYTPGNHDISEPPTAEGLTRYREAFGPDFVTATIGGRELISFNSLLLRGGPADEMESCHARLDSALTAAKEARRPIIAMCHVPPFADNIEEADEYFNLPSAMRRDMLDRFAEAGVFVWLCGHTHKTHRNDYKGIAILNPENTSCNFDKRPKGCRILTIAPDNSFTWEFVGID